MIPPSPDQPGAGTVTVPRTPPSLIKTYELPTGRPVAADADGAATDGFGVGDGVADGGAPTPVDAGDPSICVPTTRATTTAAAPRPMGTSLFMVGNLHGPMTDRCCVPSIRSRTASNDGSGSSVGPSRRKASSCRSSSCCVVMRIAPRDRRVPGHRPRGRRGAPVSRGACGTSRSPVGCRVARPPRVAKARGSGGRPARRAVRR